MMHLFSLDTENNDFSINLLMKVIRKQFYKFIKYFRFKIDICHKHIHGHIVLKYLICVIEYIYKRRK